MVRLKLMVGLKHWFIDTYNIVKFSLRFKERQQSCGYWTENMA